jgi:hypothetical protein
MTIAERRDDKRQRPLRLAELAKENYSDTHVDVSSNDNRHAGSIPAGSTTKRNSVTENSVVEVPGTRPPFE